MYEYVVTYHKFDTTVLGMDLFHLEWVASPEHVPAAIPDFPAGTEVIVASCRNLNDNSLEYVALYRNEGHYGENS